MIYLVVTVKNINFWVKIKISKISILSHFVNSKLRFGLKLAPIVMCYDIQAKKLYLEIDELEFSFLQNLIFRLLFRI